MRSIGAWCGVGLVLAGTSACRVARDTPTATSPQHSAAARVMLTPPAAARYRERLGDPCVVCDALRAKVLSGPTDVVRAEKGWFETGREQLILGRAEFWLVTIEDRTDASVTFLLRAEAGGYRVVSSHCLGAGGLGTSQRVVGHWIEPHGRFGLVLVAGNRRARGGWETTPRGEVLHATNGWSTWSVLGFSEAGAFTALRETAGYDDARFAETARGLILRGTCRGGSDERVYDTGVDGFAPPLPRNGAACRTTVADDLAP
jgi:hypothetical protein